MEKATDNQEAFEVEIEDVIDLHAFSARDTKEVVPEYLYQCKKRGFTEVRIIHGRGKGVQRRIVQSILDRYPGVVRYRDAEPFRGGWGAVVVQLDPSVMGEDEE